MKVTTTITLDISIAKLLSEQPNKSGLINKLLENYFSEKEEQQMQETAA